MGKLRTVIAAWIVIAAFVPTVPSSLLCGRALADPASTIYPEFSAPWPKQDIPYPQLLQYLERGQIYRVLWQGNIITAELVDGRFVRSAVEGDDGLLLHRLTDKGVGVAREL